MSFIEDKGNKMDNHENSVESTQYQSKLMSTPKSALGKLLNKAWESKQRALRPTSGGENGEEEGEEQFSHRETQAKHLSVD